MYFVFSVIYAACLRGTATSRRRVLGSVYSESVRRVSAASLVDFGGGSRFGQVVSSRSQVISLSVPSVLEVFRGPRETFGNILAS